MPMLTFWITLGLFLAVTVLELVFAFFEMDKPRSIVKPFCVSVPAIAALIISPNLLGGLIFLGAMLGVLGDICLIFKKNQKLFVVGTGFFLLGHITYIALMIVLFRESIHWYNYLILAMLHLTVWGLSLYAVHKLIKDWRLCIPGCFYLSTLFMEVVWGFFMAGMATEKMLVVAIGSTIFLSSDIYLVKCNFYKHSKREDFFIMLLYLIGQGLIIYGLLFSGGAIFA